MLESASARDGRQRAANRVAFVFWALAFAAWEIHLGYRSTRVAFGGVAFVGASVASSLLAILLAIALGLVTRTLRASLLGLLAGISSGVPLALLIAFSIKANGQAAYEQRNEEFVTYARTLLSKPQDETHRQFDALRQVSAPELVCRLGRRKSDWRYIGIPDADALPDPPVSNARLLQVGAFVADSGKSPEEKRIALALLLEALRQRDATDSLREWAALWRHALPDALRQTSIPHSEYPNERRRLRKYNVDGCGYADDRIYQSNSLCLVLGLSTNSSVDSGSGEWAAAVQGLHADLCPGRGENGFASGLR